MKKFTFVLAALAVAMFSFAQEITVKKTVSDLVTELNWTISQSGKEFCYTSFDLDNSIQVSTTGEPNCGSVWSTKNGPEWRLYQAKKGNVTIQSKDGAVISSVKLTYSPDKGGILQNGTTTCSSNSAIDVNATSITLTVGNSGTATTGQIKITAFEVSYTPATPAAVATPVLTPEEGKVTDGAFTEPFLLTISCATEDASIVYTLDGTDPAESETAVEYTAAITISKSTKVRAIALGGDAEFSREVAAEYGFVNSAATAYTVSEAIDVIDAGLGLNNKLYAKGTVKEITEIETAQYGNATYVITDGEKDLTVFRGKYIGGEKFTAENQLIVGDAVVVYGILTLYKDKDGGETYEFTSGNELISIDHATSTGCVNAEEALKAVKVIENGQLFIIRDGVKYNAQGAVIE